MARNSEALVPFIDEKVKAHLQKSKGKVQPESEHLVLGSQPDSVTTTLRDYQMIGAGLDGPDARPGHALYPGRRDGPRKDVADNFAHLPLEGEHGRLPRGRRW